MVDVFSKEKRAEIMSANRGKETKSTEKRLQLFLEGANIIGWRANAIDIKGKPDFVFDEFKVAIFVDGCFWHGCPDCRKIPASNHDFWEKKIRRTKERDQEITLFLEENGWKVIRIWEHQLKRASADCLDKIRSRLY